MSKLFAFYMDESGSPKPNIDDETPHFAVGGVLIRSEDKEEISRKVAEFKRRWKPDINENTDLHGNKIRSKKSTFAWLGTDKDRHGRFLQDLEAMILECPILVHGCVISRKGYLDRYLERYGKDTWEMMKSSFSILLERVSKYVALQEGEVMIYFEKAGEKEDGLITDYFYNLRDSGLPFNTETSDKYLPLTAEQMKKVLTGIEGKPKSNPILQIADLCLYPVARAKDQPENWAFQNLSAHHKLIDTVIPSDNIEKLGIKYYCFDSLGLKH